MAIGSTPPVSNNAAAPNAHADHGAPSANTGGDQSFATALNQAIGQAAANGGHAGHGNADPSGGSPHVATQHAPMLSSSADRHSSHFPIGGSHQGGGHDFQQNMLTLRVYRQQLIASNIANADTPGYKAVDLDFAEAVRMVQSSGPPLQLSVSEAGHIAGSSHQALPQLPIKYQQPTQPSADGNTVDMDVERAKMAENTLMHQFSLDRVSSHFKHMMELLQSLK